MCPEAFATRKGTESFRRTGVRMPNFGVLSSAVGFRQSSPQKLVLKPCMARISYWDSSKTLRMARTLWVYISFYNIGGMIGYVMWPQICVHLVRTFRDR